jgi:hypothetical protein
VPSWAARHNAENGVKSAEKGSESTSKSADGVDDTKDPAGQVQLAVLKLEKSNYLREELQEALWKRVIQLPSGSAPYFQKRRMKKVLAAVVADIRKQADSAVREARRSGNKDAVTFTMDAETLVEKNVGKVTLKTDLRQLLSSVLRDVVAAAGTTTGSDTPEGTAVAEQEQESCATGLSEDGGDAGSAVSAAGDDLPSKSQVEIVVQSDDTDSSEVSDKISEMDWSAYDVPSSMRLALPVVLVLIAVCWLLAGLWFVCGHSDQGEDRSRSSRWRRPRSKSRGRKSKTLSTISSSSGKISAAPAIKRTDTGKLAAIATKKEEALDRSNLSSVDLSSVYSSA